MNQQINSFRDLRIWQQGIELVREIYKITTDFPKNEIFGLSNQIRRASISIPSNIAEGHIRKNTAEFKQFLYIALGSLAELETQILIANDLKFLENKDYSAIINRIDVLGKQIRSLINKLQTKPKSPNPKPKKL